MQNLLLRIINSLRSRRRYLSVGQVPSLGYCRILCQNKRIDTHSAKCFSCRGVIDVCGINIIKQNVISLIGKQGSNLFLLSLSTSVPKYFTFQWTKTIREPTDTFMHRYFLCLLPSTGAFPLVRAHRLCLTS